MLTAMIFRQLASLRSLPERLRFRLYPRFAKFCLDRATKLTRASLTKHRPIGVLVDNTVLGLAITHESKWISTGGPRSGNDGLGTGYLARVPVYGKNNDGEDYIDTTYLTGVAHLARLGFIKLFTSAELDDEQLRQPAGRYRGYGYFDYSLFWGINIDSLDGDVAHSFGVFSQKLPSLADQQRKRLKLKASDDEQYRYLYALLQQQLGKKCSQDSWHIRTAERHGISYFLTTDRPLLKACESLQKKEPLASMKVRVLSPKEFAVEFGIKPVSPILLSYNDASFFVRKDHNMPGQRRRKLKEYRKN